jgi:peptidyl-prolyl cis-trans isomerase B (cyclophilin B)
MNSRFWPSVICVVTSIVLLAGCESKKKENQEVKEKPDEAQQAAPAEEQKSIEPEPKGPATVKFETSMGDIVIELNEEKAPITVANFLRYVNEGFYDGTIFHRVIKGFMIQGGGFDTAVVEKSTHEPIKNESSNGLKNDRGTIAMARTPVPDSATAQFFINHRDNAGLNYPSNGGYAVFGKIVQGMDVVDAIASVRTTNKIATTRAGKQPFQDVPVDNVTIISAKVVSN